MNKGNKLEIQDTKELVHEQKQTKKDTKELVYEQKQTKQDTKELVHEQKQTKQDTKELVYEQKQTKQDTKELVHEQKQTKKNTKELVHEKKQTVQSNKGDLKGNKQKIKEDLSTQKVNRNYKDSVFRLLFSDKKELLNLCNAVSGRNYTDHNQIEIETLEDAIYISYKNDISFVLDGRLALYEHQSTWSLNIPLRSLIYISNSFAKLISGENIYGSKQIKIPNPEFYVFYNGTQDKPERSVQKLSSSFVNQKDEVNLELKVTILNINKGYNVDIMEKCPKLLEYMQFIERVRVHQGKNSMEWAVKKAIEECIEEGILEEFLRKHRAEVESMCLFECSVERYEEMIREEGIEQGIEEGIKQGIERGIEQGIEQERISSIIKTYHILQDMGVSEELINARLCATYNVTNEELWRCMYNVPIDVDTL